MASRKSKKKSDFSAEERREIAARVHKARDEIGLLQHQVAKKMSYSTSHYAKMENGIALFSRRLLEGFAETFGVSLHWLLTGEGEMFANGHRAAEAADRDAASSQAPPVDSAVGRRILEITRSPQAEQAVHALCESLDIGEDDAWDAVVQAKLKAEGNRAD